MDEKENLELSLEEIMREFGSEPVEEPVAEEAPEQTEEEQLEDLDVETIHLWTGSKSIKKAEDMQSTRRMDVADLQSTRRMDAADLQSTRRIDSADLQSTRRIEPVELHLQKRDLSGETIRLDGLPETFPVNEKMTQDTQRIWQKEETAPSEPFSQNWEPEYENPIGEYVPPQPIQFQPRSRFQELKKKLVEGPERRYYQLMEKGIGKLQAAIFFSLLVVLVCAASTAMYAIGMVDETRIRLMVFVQFIAMLISACLGSNQLIDGVSDLAKKKFTLNSLLAITFFVCFIDGIVCLRQVRVPCCAAFSLEMTMSLWGAYHRRSTEMAQMDTLRKATCLNGVAVCPDYMDGQKGFLRNEGQLEDFMDRYAETGRPEKTINRYSMIATIISFAIGIFAWVMDGFAGGVQVVAVSLLAAVPATAFITHTRPMWLLERRLHKLGTVLCGWQSVEVLSGKAVFPVTFADLYPADAMRLNGVKYFGSRDPDQVAAYATAVITAADCGLTGLFQRILDSRNGWHYDAYDVTHYDNGGVCGVVEGELVLIGSASFMRDMDIAIPENARVSYGVYVAIEEELSGLFAVSYEKTRSAAAGLTTLGAYKGLRSALVSDDFMLTPGFMRNKFGVKSKRFLLPDYEIRAQLRQKTPEPEEKSLLLTTSAGLAPVAYGVTGARALRMTCRMGTVLHIVGGAIGLAIMLTLTVLGGLEALTPTNILLYELVWMIPALLFTEWTRSI